MIIPTKEYLISLLEDAKSKFNDYETVTMDDSKMDVTYVATKKRNLMGIKDGYDGLYEMKKYHVKETPSIRSNCQYYNKFYKIDGKVQKIESYVAGHDRLDVIYLAYYEQEKRYLFPHYVLGTEIIKDESNYTIVTHYEDDKVVEEYMVAESQIVYDKYEYNDPYRVDHYGINYVPYGKEPVLGEGEGYFDLHSSEYREKWHHSCFESE